MEVGKSLFFVLCVYIRYFILLLGYVLNWVNREVNIDK